MLKVVITGPESTGKSTLAKELATYYNTLHVDEFSRGYLSELRRTYVQQDLTEIAKGQIKLEDSAAKKTKELLICDTSLEVIRIWSEYKYGNCDPFILEKLAHRLPDLYLLMAPDLPWQPDPLRENPNDRTELYTLYKKELINSQVPFYEISGISEKRFKMAKEVIDRNI